MYYPGRERNTFIHTTWSIVCGLVIVGIIRWLDIQLLDNILKSNLKTFPTFSYILALLITGVIFGLLLIWINKIRFKVSQKWPKFNIAPDPKRIWAKINQEEIDQWVVVYVDDGAVYTGWIKNYTFDPNSENQDFLLASAQRVDDDLKVKYEVTGIGVYLNTKDIKRIEFLKGE